MEIRKLLTIAGGSTKLGRLLGVSKQTFYAWQKVPAEHVPKISAAYGIPRHELRPDLWEPPQP